MAERSTKVLNIFAETGAIVQNGHFVYASGLHGSVYLNKDALYPYTRLVSELCQKIAGIYVREGVKIDTVLGPAVGGVLLASYTAGFLTEMYGLPVMAVHADKAGDGFEIRRGFPVFVTGKNVLVVEDIFTTGGSAEKTVAAVRKIGGNVVAVAGLCNRGGVTAQQLGVPRLDVLLTLPAESFPEDECPLCARQVPINTELGHGSKYLAERAAR